MEQRQNYTHNRQIFICKFYDISRDTFRKTTIKRVQFLAYPFLSYHHKTHSSRSMPQKCIRSSNFKTTTAIKATNNGKNGLNLSCEKIVFKVSTTSFVLVKNEHFYVRCLLVVLNKGAAAPLCSQKKLKKRFSHR